MPIRADNLLRANISGLLRERHYKQKDLAFRLRVHTSTINKFLKGTREVQLVDLDKIADFFGLDTYQLFQPGIVQDSERRSGTDRRSGRERRASVETNLLVATANDADALTPGEREALARFEQLPPKARRIIIAMMGPLGLPRIRKTVEKRPKPKKDRKKVVSGEPNV